MSKAPQTLMPARQLPEEGVSTIGVIQQKAAALQKRGGETFVTAKGRAAGVAVTTKDEALALAKRGGEAFVVAKGRAVEVAGTTKDQAVALATDRRAQVTAVSAAAGGAAVGTGGAAVGLVTGGALGAAVGLVPALFTFGLSIPLGAMLGGGCGLVVGGATGTMAGATTSGAVGYGTYTKRAEIKAAIVGARNKVKNGAKKTKEVAIYLVARSYAGVNSRIRQIKNRVGPHLMSVKEKAELHLGAAGKKTAAAILATKNKTREVASQKSAQVTAVSAAGGAVVVGTGGAATGLLTGGALGAAVGLVPAIFTFGLSIPAFAIVGGGCGLATGAAVGGTTGAVVGGASGYGIFTKREVIGTNVKKTVTYIKETASKSAGFFRSKLSGGATGGTSE